jgi:hypothetical protein
LRCGWAAIFGDFSRKFPVVNWAFWVCWRVLVGKFLVVGEAQIFSMLPECSEPSVYLRRTVLAVLLKGNGRAPWQPHGATLPGKKFDTLPVAH